MWMVVLGITLLQILVLSIIVPALYHRYSLTLVKRYPEVEYPLLYTLGETTRIRRRKICTGLNAAAALVCVLILSVSLTTEYFIDHATDVLLLLLMIQILPLFLPAYWEQQVKNLRKHMPPPTKRSSSLTIRHWRDFISPYAIGTVALIFAAGVTLPLYFSWRGLFDWIDTAALIAISLIMLISFYSYIKNKVLNPREDPYIHYQNVLNRARLEINLFLFIYGFWGMLMLLMLLKRMPWFPEAMGSTLLLLLVSVFAQGVMLLIAWHTTRQLRTTDFSVYKLKFPTAKQSNG